MVQRASQRVSMRLACVAHLGTYKFVESSGMIAFSTEAREATAADAEGSASRAVLVDNDTAACILSVWLTDLLNHRLQPLTTVSSSELLCPHETHVFLLLVM